MDDIVIAGVCSVLVAAFNFGGIIWQNRRIREVHDCLHEVHETVRGAADAADARDIRNEGGDAILSQVKGCPPDERRSPN